MVIKGLKKVSIKNYLKFVLLVSASFLTITLANQVRADSLPNTGAPAGFSLTSVAEGLYLPVNAEFASDGRIFVIEKGGAVKIVKDGQVLARPFYTVPNVNDYVDRGLSGIALDPQFATNGYVYLLYTYDNNPSNVAGPKTGRLIRVTANGDVAAPGSEKIILGSVVGDYQKPSCMDFPANTDCLAADGLSHAPGSLKFAPDGKLFVSLGDASGYDDVDMNAFRAQDLTNLAGKILRINPDGTAPADNPFYTGNPTDNQSKVYALGTRNAFRMTIRESDGLLMTGDVGWNTWEEVNVVEPGSNLGWPCYEGHDQQNGAGSPDISAYKDLTECQKFYAAPPANLTFPIHVYPHPPSSAVVSGEFYNGGAYPDEYDGRFFYGDYAKDQIYMLDLDGIKKKVPGSDKVFASNAGGPVGFFTAPDGTLYYLAIMKGAVYKIEYSTANRAPTAFADSDRTFGGAPLDVQFTSSGSTDPEGDTLNFRWDFGDGSAPSTEANPKHTYVAEGMYTVTLTVSDEFNNKDTKTLTIHAGQTAPTVTIDTPTDFMYAAPEQVINFSGSATDIQDGAIDASKLKWQAAIQHCPLDSCHVHNVLAATGKTGSFIFPKHDGPFYVEITLSVTNSSGLTTTKSVSVYPQGQPITSSMKFDGINDYAVAATPQDFRLQQFTAEAMVKALTTDDYGSEVLSAGNNWSARVTPDGNVQFSFNSNYTWQILRTSNVNVKDGLWHHIAVSRTGNAMKIYVDGEIKAQNENVNPIHYVYGGDFVVGRHGDGDDHFNFNGAIDEVRVWNAPRTDEQIAQYHSSTLPKDSANLVAYYDAEDGRGQTATDKSPAGTHALTLINGTTWTAGAPLPAPGTVVTPPPAPVEKLRDTFTGSAINLEKWTVYQPAANTTQNEQLQIKPSTTGPGYFGVTAKTPYALKDSDLFVQAVQTTATATSAEMQLLAELDKDNAVMIGHTNGSLHMRLRTNGTNADAFAPYNAATMQWWRIRHAADKLYFETSADTKTWTVRRTVTSTFDVSKVKIILQAGTWQTVANPGTARFDNLNTLPAAPAANKAVTFDGTTGSQAILKSDHAHYQTQALTVEAAVKVSATGKYGGEVLSNGNNYGLRVLPDGNIRFFIHTGKYIWKDYETTGLNLKDNTWHHVAATKNASQVVIYVDGKAVKTFTSTEAISYTLGASLVIGRHGDGDDNFNLSGSVDDIRIWNVARTAQDIAQYDMADVPPATTGLQAYWKMNEGTGVAAASALGDEHSLQLSATKWTDSY